jgi:hypothetical protein
MRRIPLLLFSFLIVILQQPEYVNAGPGDYTVQRDMKTPHARGTFKEGELLVKFKPRTSNEAKLKIHKKIGSEVIREFHSTKIQHVRLRKGLGVDEAIRFYKADPNVEYAEPNGMVEIQE